MQDWIDWKTVVRLRKDDCATGASDDAAISLSKNLPIHNLQSDNILPILQSSNLPIQKPITQNPASTIMISAVTPRPAGPRRNSAASATSASSVFFWSGACSR